MTTSISKERIDSRLQRIANVLLLNASFIENLGLLNGKMGIAIFFYHYAKYTGNEVYSEYAGELIDEIYCEINTSTPIDFENGLTGIGWGIEYLVQNGFVEANTDEVLEQIDNVIFRATMQAPISILDQTALFGFGLFYLARLKGREHDNEKLETLKKKQMLIYMMDECERLLTKDKLFDVPVPQLTLHQINSLAWFILHTRRLDLFPVKSNKLIVQLEDYVKTKMEGQPNAIDTAIFCHMLNDLKPLIPAEVLMKYERLSFVEVSNENDANEEHLINQYLKYGWCSILYSIELGNILDGKAEKAFKIIDNEEYWNTRLDKLNKNNMGLDTGMAGLGMAVMAELKNLKNDIAPLSRSDKLNRGN